MSHDNLDVPFFQLVLSLQAAVVQQMGKVVSPIDGQIQRDLALAKGTIDILEMLGRKTKGNLTVEEKNLLDHVLYELRMNYLDESAKDQAGAGSSGTPSPTDSSGMASEGGSSDTKQ